MSRGEKAWLAAGVAYALMAVFSFGHGAARGQEEVDRCEARARLNPKAYCLKDAGMSGLGAALLWPLYWSWELQTSPSSSDKEA